MPMKNSHCADIFHSLCVSVFPPLLIAFPDHFGSLNQPRTPCPPSFIPSPLANCLNIYIYEKLSELLPAR